MYHFDKHFTLAEANGLLPRIREIFQQIHNLLQATIKKDPITSVPKDPLPPARTNGTYTKPVPPEHEITQTINSLITEITDQGIVIQDIMRGLIDFPSFVDGEEVFLCYEISDGERIEYWHPLDSGYAGRKPISGDFLIT